MKKVFISGSIALKFIPQMVYERLDNMIKGGLEILVGDALGIDLAVQEYFKKRGYFNVCVYGIYESARNMASAEFNFTQVKVPLENVKKERERQFFKDEEMARACDYGLVIWDEKSSGCYKNIQNLYKFGKKYVVWDDKIKDFLKENEAMPENVKICYEANNGLSGEEFVERLNMAEIKNTRDLNRFLMDKNFIKKDGDAYMAQSGYERYFIRKIYKGQETKQIKYSVDLIEKVEALLGGEIREQRLLF